MARAADVDYVVQATDDPAEADFTVNALGGGSGTIESGAGAPSSTPAAIGDHYIDTTNDNAYVAVCTTSAACWKQATGAGGGDLLAANNLSDVANAGTSRTNLGLAIGTDVQAYAAALDSVSGTNTGDEAAASDTVAGVVELATIAEVDTGTDTTRAVTPDALEGSALQAKVDGIEALADVTDVTNVTAAGALMDSEVDADIKTFTLPASTTISAFGATVVDDANAAAVRATIGADITSANDVDDLTNIVATTQAGATYTLALGDAHSLVYFSNAAEVTVTIPLNAAVAFETGTRITLMSTGAGGLTLSTTSITLLGSSPNKTIAQNEGLYLEKIATDTWAILGGTAA